MESLLNANIVAPATVPGSGAVGIIRVSGADAITIASAIFKPAKGNRSTKATLKNTDSYKLTFGRITEGEKLIDEVLAAIFRAPNSYTGENAVEIYCHASSFIMNKIQMLLLNVASELYRKKTISAPLRMAEPGEFTKRAFLNGKMDLAQAEAVADLIASETEASHNIAMNQMRGGFSKELRAMRESLLNLCALIELELDFSEEDVEFADRKHLTALLENILKKINELSSSFAEGNAIKNGIPVAIVGAVNTGKSTLLNLLVGEERAIVSPIQGTTRDTIEDNVNIAGTLFRFIDTAGIRNTTETIEMMGIERTWQKLKESSVIILVTDATRENTILPSLKSIAEKRRKEQKLIVVANKCDMLKERESLEQKIKEHCKKLKLTGVTVICTSLKKEREVSKKSITHQLSLYGKGFLSNLQG